MQTYSFEFSTERLSVFNWQQFEFDLADQINNITTSNVMKDLPAHWKNLNSKEQVVNWIKQRELECTCLAITNKEKDSILGLIFMYFNEEEKSMRTGYLFGEQHWGNQYATEVIDGLCIYCAENLKGYKLMGGVTQNNIASIKVLKKNNFQQVGDVFNDTLFFERTF